MSDRDLSGYGGKWPNLVWPNGSRLAVSVALNFEEGAELEIGDGDDHNEPLGEVLSAVLPGQRDIGQEQMFAYGLRAGIWRMLDALSGSNIPATVFLCGRAVERTPDLARILVEHGHEPAAHGWRWRPHADYSNRDEELRDLVRCVEVIEEATGVRPLGFFCRGSESRWTRSILSELGFVYTSNAFDDDLPYFDEDHSSPRAGPLVVVPYSLDTNDMKFFHPNGFVRATEMVEYVEDALNTLQREADRGYARLASVGFHLRICGRPGRFPAFERILKLLADRRDRIWVATRLDIAQAFSASSKPLR